MAREMTSDEVRAFLSEGTRTGKLATTMADGAPHVMPIWFVLDVDDIVLNTGADTVKARAIARDPRVAFVVDDEAPPYAFVHIRGVATISDDLADVRRFATLIGERYMGADRAEEFGARNGVPGEVLVRITPQRTIATADLAD